ncbi:MAG: GNAT family N-acetyltransferase [Vulcanimicrobiaceae bacterium]
MAEAAEPQPPAEIEIEIESGVPPAVAAFRAREEREAQKTLWGFTVVPHAQRHALLARRDGTLVGLLELEIAASLARIGSFIVSAAYRRRGIGSALLARAEELANYYNCHKVTLEVPAGRPARAFFEARGYHLEAILPQHTWKLEVAVLRKFLL